MDLEIKGKAVAVTGSSKGIGKAIAFRLAKEGANLSLCARNLNRLKETAREIESTTRVNVIPIKADLASSNEIETFVKETVKGLGGIDILVNNIGGPLPLLS